MHLDTHFLEFEFLDYDNVKPLKSKFSINSYLASKTCFLIWYWSALHVLGPLNHAPNPFKMQQMSEISKLIFFDLLSIYFLTIGQTSKFCKVGFKKRFIQLLKLSKTSTYHIWCPHVVQKDNLLRHHLFSNLLVTNLCFFTREDYFFGIL
jgi:hypothetical protein